MIVHAKQNDAIDIVFLGLMATLPTYTKERKMKIESEAIEMQVDMEIDAGRDETFAFWRAIENFPRFMPHVKEVQAVGENRSFWRVEGPVGIDFNWEADVVDIVEGREFTWRTVPNAQVQSTGKVSFVDKGQDKTQVAVSLSYVPPAGPMGHTLATMLGLNPQQQLQVGLAKCKEILEHRVAAAPSRGPAGTEQDEGAARYSTP